MSKTLSLGSGTSGHRTEFLVLSNSIKYRFQHTAEMVNSYILRIVAHASHTISITKEPRLAPINPTRTKTCRNYSRSSFNSPTTKHLAPRTRQNARLWFPLIIFLLGLFWIVFRPHRLVLFDQFQKLYASSQRTLNRVSSFILHSAYS